MGGLHKRIFFALNTSKLNDNAPVATQHGAKLTNYQSESAIHKAKLTKHSTKFTE
jgi:hypothetical protein